MFYYLNKEAKRRRQRKVTTTINARTLTKRVANKVNPVRGSIYETNGSLPSGNPNQRNKYLTREVAIPPSTRKFDSIYLTKKFSNIKRGSRLTLERLVVIKPSLNLIARETKLLYELLFNREAALIYNFTYLGRVNLEVAPPQRIRTVLYEPQEHPSYKINPSLRPIIEYIVRERYKAGTLELSYSVYRNPTFLVKKKQSKDKTLALNNPKLYRLINDTQRINRVTLRDTNLPPDTNSFAKDFARYIITSLINIFSRYDQITLYEDDRDLISFKTLLRLFRITTIP